MTADSMTSAMCLVNRHGSCRNLAITRAYVGPCACTECGHGQDQDEEMAA